MEAANIIRDAVARVSLLRQTHHDCPELACMVGAVKAFQARRFTGTYADLLKAGPYRPAAQFFLEELYSNKDYTARDEQFARIAGALQRIFPEQVVQTAVSMARLHGLTEELDDAMARHWLAHQGDPNISECGRYVAAWRAVGRPADRRDQLETVLAVGRELDRLTRAPGLRMLLRMMRRPAAMAGLSSLQQFLECGFDTFAEMGRKGSGATLFLETIRTREAALMDLLFDADPVTSETELTATLGQAR
ncbi:FFLEELY motif protein [Rhodoferax sp.]|uniref:FFLEELY motif protein n=1 Tax=Rhodoferax sp. TaxID=50421 RepID=UPI00274F211A|nr:hypothetical protein [Rhodoferax sp.]